MEWGPRALGNRSILCESRRADMKDSLNLKIKRRESFRPFAPSILREAVRDWGQFL
jgi:carbamoyltransferase